MASLVNKYTKLQFKLDSGVANASGNGTIKHSVTLAGIKAAADATALSSVAVACDGIFELDTDSILLNKQQELVI